MSARDLDGEDHSSKLPFGGAVSESAEEILGFGPSICSIINFEFVKYDLYCDLFIPSQR